MGKNDTSFAWRNMQSRRLSSLLRQWALLGVGLIVGMALNQLYYYSSSNSHMSHMLSSRSYFSTKFQYRTTTEPLDPAILETAKEVLRTYDHMDDIKGSPRTAREQRDPRHHSGRLDLIPDREERDDFISIPELKELHHPEKQDKALRREPVVDRNENGDNKKETNNDALEVVTEKRTSENPRSSGKKKKHFSERKSPRHSHKNDDSKEEAVAQPFKNQDETVSAADYYLEGNKIVGDVSGLLDFGILGFAKTATTYLKDWFKQQRSHISISSEEVCYLNKKEGSKLVHHLVDDLDETKMRGFKCPSHFTRPSLEWYRRYFPRTKLIVGLRHPISWFESFYNFRIRHPKYPHNATIQLPPPDELIGRCRLESRGLCTYNAEFHRQLARMGKTPLNSTERSMLHLDRSDILGLGSARVDNPVFLYEITQIRQNPAQFAADMAAFLGMNEPLKPFVEKKQSARALKAQAAKKKAIQICEPKYDKIRQELMKTAWEASDCILDYYMQHVTITTSPTSSFVEAKQRWKKDPCEAKKTMATTKTTSETA